jgi:hypothetical protein
MTALKSNGPNIVAFIFARGGSKGVPRKNVKLLAGVPLIGHAVKAALAARGVTRCVVSTDDPEIAEVARRYGAETPFMRPPELAADTAPEWLAWRHYNTIRPHSSLGYRPPAPETASQPLPPSGSASLHLQAAMATEAICSNTQLGPLSGGRPR